MTSRYVLAFWKKSKKISILKEESFEKTFGENGREIPLAEGAARIVPIGEKRLEAKILRICSSKKYLESLLVTKEGTILLHGTKPPSSDCLAKKSRIQDEEDEILNKEKQFLNHLPLNAGFPSVERTGSSYGNSRCNNGCPTCCSGSLPHFPKLPDGFLSTLVSLAEYFQKVQKASEENCPAPAPTDITQHLNTWQWASREKVELRKGGGVWVDAIRLEKILGQAQITKKPPHQTLVKSLLVHLMGVDKYIETTAEKIDRRLLSAVVGFANAKYPELAQPIERYYRCINLNRGYLLKRKNEGAFDHEDPEGVGCNPPRRSGGSARSIRRNSMEEGNGFEDPYSRRSKVRVVNREPLRSNENTLLNRYQSNDQVIIPLDVELSEEGPTIPDSNIFIVHSELAKSGYVHSSLPQPTPQQSVKPVYARSSVPPPNSQQSVKNVYIQSRVPQSGSQHSVKVPYIPNSVPLTSSQQPAKSVNSVTQPPAPPPTTQASNTDHAYFNDEHAYFRVGENSTEGDVDDVDFVPF